MRWWHEVAALVEVVVHHVLRLLLARLVDLLLDQMGQPVLLLHALDVVHSAEVLRQLCGVLTLIDWNELGLSVVQVNFDLA